MFDTEYDVSVTMHLLVDWCCPLDNFLLSGIKQRARIGLSSEQLNKLTATIFTKRTENESFQSTHIPWILLSNSIETRHIQITESVFGEKSFEQQQHITTDAEVLKRFDRNVSNTNRFSSPLSLPFIPALVRIVFASRDNYHNTPRAPSKHTANEDF